MLAFLSAPIKIRIVFCVALIIIYHFFYSPQLLTRSPIKKIKKLSLVGSVTWDGLERDWPIFLKGSCWATRNGVNMRVWQGFPQKLYCWSFTTPTRQFVLKDLLLGYWQVVSRMSFFIQTTLGFVIGPTKEFDMIPLMEILGLYQLIYSLFYYWNLFSLFTLVFLMIFL